MDEHERKINLRKKMLIKAIAVRKKLEDEIKNKEQRQTELDRIDEQIRDEKQHIKSIKPKGIFRKIYCKIIGEL